MNSANLKWCCYHQRHEDIDLFGKSGGKLQTACRAGMSQYHKDRYATDPSFRKRQIEYAIGRSKTPAAKAARKAARQRTLAKHRKRINRAALKRHHERYATDVSYKMRFRLRGSLSKAVKRGAKRRRYRFLMKKQASAVRDLGCSVPTFLGYIEAQFKPGMSWDNWGKTWHLDHIQPLFTFDLSDKNQFLKACHYTNYQPLFVADHKEKTALELSGCS